MSKEAWNQGPKSPEAPRDTEPARVSEQLVVPEQVPVASEAEIQKIDAVRDRLGLSRREVIAGSLAGAVALSSRSSEALAASYESSVAELGSYEEGINHLRELARTSAVEDLYLYVQNDSGEGQWVNVAGNTDVATGSNRSSALFAPAERRQAELTREMVRKGSNVEMVHTHPTKVFDSQSSSEAADASVLRRVPPSPVDLINMFGVENGLTNTEKERMSFSTVSEDGRWIYEAKPDAQMESAIAASEPFIRQLSGPYARHAPAAARALRNFVYQSSNNDRASMQGVEPVIRSMQTGSYPDYLRSTPTSLFQHAQLFKGLSANSNMPDGAKLYFGAIVNAYDAMDTTLREKDPDGHGFLETFSTIPMMEDGQGDFAPYREFWDKRGVNLRYEPFGV